MVNIGVNCVTDNVFDAAGVRSLSYFFAENSDHRANVALSICFESKDFIPEEPAELLHSQIRLP